MALGALLLDPGIILFARLELVAAVVRRDAVRGFPALAILIPVEALAEIDHPAAAIDQIGVVIITHPAPVLARIGEAVALPVLDVELRAEPERVDDAAAPQPVREAPAGPEMRHANAAAPAAAAPLAAADHWPPP